MLPQHTTVMPASSPDYMVAKNYVVYTAPQVDTHFPNHSFLCTLAAIASKRNRGYGIPQHTAQCNHCYAATTAQFVTVLKERLTLRADV